MLHHKARGTIWEVVIYCFVVLAVAAFDLFIIKFFLNLGTVPAAAKITATALVLVFNFVGRRRYLVFLVFPLATRGRWSERKQGEWIQER